MSTDDIVLLPPDHDEYRERQYAYWLRQAWLNYRDACPEIAQRCLDRAATWRPVGVNEEARDDAA